jgi:hypothetical protein
MIGHVRSSPQPHYSTQIIADEILATPRNLGKPPSPELSKHHLAGVYVFGVLPSEIEPR